MFFLGRFAFPGIIRSHKSKKSISRESSVVRITSDCDSLIAGFQSCPSPVSLLCCGQSDHPELQICHKVLNVFLWLMGSSPASIAWLSGLT